MPRVMVLGESRFDADFSDREIVEAFLAGNSLSSATFIKFTQAISGMRCGHTGYDERKVWEALIFHNYMRAYFQGQSRVRVKAEDRTHPANDENLQFVLKKYKPTHMIVWGKDNYKGLDNRLTKWSAESELPETGNIYCHTVIDGQKIFVTYVYHPSTGFSLDRWSSVLSEFLALR